MRILPVATAALWLTSAALAQDAAPGKGIYTCTTPDGRKLTSDRPIPGCTSREQRVLNPDGSQRTTLPPFLSPEERAFVLLHHMYCMRLGKPLTRKAKPVLPALKGK